MPPSRQSALLIPFLTPMRSVHSATPGVTIRIVNVVQPEAPALPAPAIDVRSIEDRLTRDVNGNPIFRVPDRGR
jgi:hypothetical protein